MINTDYETRVRALEAQGATRSDAQAVVDAELLRESKQRAIDSAIRCRSFLPYRIHYIYFLPKENGWYSGCSKTMRRPNTLVRNGANVELLK